MRQTAKNLVITIVSWVKGFPMFNHKFTTIVIDGPHRFRDKRPRVNPEGKHYPTMHIRDIMKIPVGKWAANNAHIYFWVPNALLGQGLACLQEWGFDYKTSLTWVKLSKEGKIKYGLGTYYRNCTEVCLFGVKGKLRTNDSAKSTPNIIPAMTGKHSVKPEAGMRIIEECSPGPYLEIFARKKRKGWTTIGNDENCDFQINFPTSEHPKEDVVYPLVIDNK